MVAACAVVTVLSVVRAASISVSRQDAVDASTPELVREFNTWVNSFFFSEGVFTWARDTMGDKGGHYFLTYVRNFMCGSLLYYFTAACWHW